MADDRRRQPPHPRLVAAISPIHGIPTTYYMVKGTKRTDFCGRCEYNLYACACPLAKRPWLTPLYPAHTPHGGGHRRHQGQTATTGSMRSTLVAIFLSLCGAILTGSVIAVFVLWPLGVMMWAAVMVVSTPELKPPPGGWYTPPHWD